MTIQNKKQHLSSDRRHFVGDSDARIIMGKDEKALLQLWKEKRGEAASPDLSGELIVQLGVVTEDLNRRWYERNAGHQVVSVQNRIFHRSIPWMAAILEKTGPLRATRSQTAQASA